MSEIIFIVRLYAGYILISIGILFDFFGCVGMIRMPDLFNRLQAGPKESLSEPHLLCSGCLLFRVLTKLG